MLAIENSGIMNYCTITGKRTSLKCLLNVRLPFTYNSICFRYKIGHFMAKNTNDPLGKLAYQCEICAKCFPSIPPLQIHKQQFHQIHELTTSSIVSIPIYYLFYKFSNESYLKMDIVYKSSNFLLFCVGTVYTKQQEI